MSEGDEERARGIILAHRADSSSDPEIHFQWGLLCEEICALKLARASFEEAIKLNPHSSKYLYRLGLLHFESGAYEKALRLATQAVKQDPGHVEARHLLAELLETMGRDGSACAVRGEAKKESPLRYFPPSLSRDDLSLFLRIFSGREIGYAIQELASGTGQGKWIYHEGTMNPEIVEKHISGQVTLGGLPLRSDNTVRYAAVSIRPHKHTIFKYLKSPSLLIQIEEIAEQQALNIIAACAAQGVSAYLEDPGEHERRVWFFFAQFFHFLLVRRFLSRILDSVTSLDSRLVMEPLLATQPVGIGWQEEAVMLPLGIDRRTEKRSLFKDNKGRLFPEQLKFTRKIREIEENGVRNSFKSAGSRKDWSGKGSKNSQDLQDISKKCPVIAELINKAGSGRKMGSDEKLILFYSFGLSARTKNLVHDILEPCPDYNFQGIERALAHLKLHPISCLKIRHIIPEITSSVNCSCSFDLRGGRYPSPFLHIEPHTSLCVAQEDFAQISLKDLANRYFLLLARREELSNDIKKLEEALTAQLGRKGLEKIQTLNGTLCRVQNGPKITIVLER